MPPAASQPPAFWRCPSLPGYFDEVTAGGEAIRPAWKPFISAIEKIGPEELARRWEQGRRLIQENGVTYNVYDETGGLNRPWQLDAVPLMIGADEWAYIEAAIAQRASLLNHVLNDVYGPRRLLAEHVMPPELLYATESFHRAASGFDVPGDVRLHFYAADIARAPTGHWWVVNDRTQAPSGSGYALENRLVMTRSLPDVFRDCQVHRLAEFFSKLRDLLAALAPAHKDRPRIVLLTPGAYNETYFEHAYLARYLGYPLVEPGDLTVRGGRVYLKTLNGLLPVDVILRRLDDGYCDPLELREDSLLGVPGLVQAARSGTVVIANSLGSGAVENPALMAFLPGLCRKVLGEELKMPSVATWWCGQPDAVRYVSEHLEDLVVKSAFLSDPGEPIFGEQLTDASRAALLKRIAAAPYRFVGQERVRLSTAPAWVQGEMQPRHLMLRVFAVAGLDGQYRVMPGGLTRVSGSRDSSLVSMQSGGGSKDTWVLSDKPVEHFSLLRMGERSTELTRQGFILPSRVADNLYWMGRYAERIENTVRVIRCALQRLTDESEFDDADELPWLIDVLVDQGRMLGGIEPEDVYKQIATLGEQLISVLFDGERPLSVRGDVQRVSRTASIVRDRISIDAWRILNRLEQQFVAPAGNLAVRLDATFHILDDAILTLTAFNGQTIEGMTHEKGWRFLDIGRRIERSLAVLGLMRHAMLHADGAEGQRMQSMLEIANNAMTYRSRYQTSVQAAPVLDLLVLDESNPRSLAYQMVALDEHINDLVGAGAMTQRNEQQRQIMRLLSTVRLTEVDVLARPNAKNQRAALAHLIDRLQTEIAELSKLLTLTYLSHARASRHLSDLGVERPS